MLEKNKEAGIFISILSDRCPRCSDVTEFGTFTSALKCSHCREGLILPESLKEGS